MFRIFLFICLFLPLTSFAYYNSFNSWKPNYSSSKFFLEDKVYLTNDDRKTIYCQAQFFEDKSIKLPEGFITQKHIKRAKRLEWEHIVPAENFGRNFIEWREGDRLCVDSKGKKYKGRRCAEKVNKEFQKMQADMYNLYPSIGAVNATRANYNFALLTNESSDFGSCQVKVHNKKVEVPPHARGSVARAYLYMDMQYKSYSMSKSQKKLMQAWNILYPVEKNECTRTKRIEEIQKNENIFVKEACKELVLWNN